MFVCMCVCLSVCVSVCVHDNSKNNGSTHLNLEHIVVYENSSDEFDIRHCPIKVKVTALEHCRKIKFSVYVNQTLIHTNQEQYYA